jgi:hypothetical protein
MATMDEQISGAMVRSHLAALHGRFGQGPYDLAIKGLHSDERDELALVTPLSWIQILTLERFYRALATSGGISLEQLHTEIASLVVGEAVKSIWRALLHLSTDEGLIGRSPSIFKKAYRQGRLDVERVTKGVADLTVLEWPDMSEFALRGFRVGIESTLRVAGRREPHAVSERTKDGATIHLEWKR